MKKVVKLGVAAKGSYSDTAMGCGKSSTNNCGISYRSGQ